MIAFPQIFRRLFRLLGMPKPSADARAAGDQFHVKTGKAAVRRAAGVSHGTGEEEPRDTRETVARAARTNDRRRGSG